MPNFEMPENTKILKKTTPNKGNLQSCLGEKPRTSPYAFACDLNAVEAQPETLFQATDKKNEALKCVGFPAELQACLKSR